MDRFFSDLKKSENTLDELVVSFSDSRKRYAEYINRCQQFAEALFQNMTAFFRHPAFRLNPSDKKEIQQLLKNMKPTDDGFWHELGPAILSIEAQKVKESLSLIILVKELDRKTYVAKLKNHSKECVIQLDRPEDFERFCQFLADAIKAFYTAGYQIHRFRHAKSNEIPVDLCKLYDEFSFRLPYFTFADLILLDSQDLHEILKSVGQNVVVLALKYCDDNVKRHVLASMSKRSAQMMQEDLDALGPVRAEDVQVAQQRIVKLTLELEQKGRIIIRGRSDF